MKMKLFFILLIVVIFDVGMVNLLMGIVLGFDLVSLCLIELNRDVFLVLMGEEFLFFLINFLFFGSEEFFGIDLLERDLGDMFGVFLGEFEMGFV